MHTSVCSASSLGFLVALDVAQGALSGPVLNLLAIRALQVLRRRDLMRSCEEEIKIATRGEPHFRKEPTRDSREPIKTKINSMGTEKKKPREHQSLPFPGWSVGSGGALRAGAGSDSLASTMGTGQSRNSADSGVTPAPG